MFKRLAKSGLARLWPVRPRRIAPGQLAAVLSYRPYSNDNLPGFRRPAVAGQRRSPTPALACHWRNRDGRLECCWHADPEDAPIGGFDDHQHSTTGRASGRSPIRSRELALAG